MNFSYQEEILPDVTTDILEGETRELVVFNDDFNTFDHVINTLIKVVTSENTELHHIKPHGALYNIAMTDK